MANRLADLEQAAGLARGRRQERKVAPPKRLVNSPPIAGKHAKPRPAPTPTARAVALRRSPRRTSGAFTMSGAARTALDAFRASTAAAAWPLIPKADLTADMEATLNDHASQVNQGRTAFCGPAAIAFELLERDQAKWVRIIRELYETGQFRSSTRTVRPSDTLRTSRASADLSLADWVFMAALRDVENAIFPVHAGSGAVVQGITTPGEMRGWASEVLGFPHVDYTSTYVGGEFEAMRTANAAKAAGGVAFIMCNSALVGNAAPLVGYPDHWICYATGLHIDNGVWYSWDSGRIRFRAWTWGQFKDVDVGESAFEDYTYGVVTGRP